MILEIFMGQNMGQIRDKTEKVECCLIYRGQKRKVTNLINYIFWDFWRQ